MTIWQRLYAGLLGAFLYPITLALVLFIFPFSEIVKSFNAIYREIVGAYQMGNIFWRLMNILFQAAKIIVMFVFTSLVLPAITSMLLYSIMISGMAQGLISGRNFLIDRCEDILTIFEQRYINDNGVLGIFRPIHSLLSQGLDYFRSRLNRDEPNNIRERAERALREADAVHLRLEELLALGRDTLVNRGHDTQPVRNNIHSLNVTIQHNRPLRAQSR